ncbi:hypothetical protein IMZ48_02655 [Candidatus Bathyarchaeota archaeon]|nr:hypothetical protein [Candidatus Bathyarchaeota archaeon]
MGNFVAGVWTGTVFVPPHPRMAPDEVFGQRPINSCGQDGRPFERFCIRRHYAPFVSPLKTAAIFTGGACIFKGPTSATPIGGFALVFNTGDHGTESGALEYQGSDGQIYGHTKTRAELRAITAALSSRTWLGEGWERIVIITDSRYVTNNATSSLRTWAMRDWMTSSRRQVENRDLWVDLSEAMGILAEGGCEVSFWEIPREFNARAYQVAKITARYG